MVLLQDALCRSSTASLTREYIMANLVTFDAGDNQVGFGVRDNAVHALEDFLIARFSWVLTDHQNQGSAKFDIMSSHRQGISGA
jgi:hypothetical protein